MPPHLARAAGGEEGPIRILARQGQEPLAHGTRAFDKAYGAKFPTEVKTIADDEDVPLAFYGYPSQHWIHSRTTNRSSPP